MSKLINLIRALLSRFTTPAQAANSAMPSDSLMTFEYAGTNTSITSPNDGYITVYAESTQTDRDLKIYPDPGASGVGSGIWLPSSTGGFAFVPVRKGQKVIVWGTNLTSASIRFFKCIGGGDKRFIFNALQRFGGGLCLSYLVTFERSLRCLDRNQLLARYSHQYQLLEQAVIKVLFLPVMAMQTFKQAVIHEFLSVTLEIRFGLLRMIKTSGLAGASFQLAKAIQFKFGLQNHKLEHSVFISQKENLSSLCIGGAL